MIYYQRGNKDDDLGLVGLREGLISGMEKLGARRKVLALPPDITRMHSFAGPLTGYCQEYFRDALTDILPALGTHTPMTREEIEKMYPIIPLSRFRVHNWREDIITLGEVPREYISEVSGGLVDYTWPAQVNRLLVEGGFDLILSIGQVVPHEVIGMANYNKNVFVGTGGTEGINKSHYLGAVYGIEKILGRAINPVRSVLNYASAHFAQDLPIIYVLTVVSPDQNNNLVVRGLYIGDDEECFHKAAELSLKVNFRMLDEPIEKVVVYLNSEEFRSTWLGNKSIYRTRMAIADGGELITLAPGVMEFGEDATIDSLIRKYGYRNTPEILEYVKNEEDLQNNLGTAAHLIQGSSEGRFNITYCPGNLGREDIENAGFHYGNLDGMKRRYDPSKLNEGWNTMPDGERIFYISNPALGLWACRDRFESS